MILRDKETLVTNNQHLIPRKPLLVPIVSRAGWMDRPEVDTM